MVVMQNKPVRKHTGGRYTRTKTRRLAAQGDLPTLTKIGEPRVRVKRTIGGNTSRTLLSGKTVSVPGTGKVVIKNVVENAANRHFVRRNIITKGAIVETDKGKVKITNRPSQEGSLSGVLVK
ncbi:MAG: 30S ribosomal protein S8e [Candidatus Woesearchaeota archaeon]|nr:MAG: 30S ribosomal protein S8e [Candidatus Woesearchaeota archaeon]